MSVTSCPFPAGRNGVVFLHIAALFVLGTVPVWSACLTQLNPSTCVIGWADLNQTSCLANARLLTEELPASCHAYAYSPSAAICAVKVDDCPRNTFTDLNGTLLDEGDECSGAAMSLFDTMTFQCSGDVPPQPTEPPRPAPPSYFFQGFCTYKTDVCGFMYTPGLISYSEDCKNMVSNTIATSGTLCQSWTYAYHNELCYIQYLDDGPSCANVTSLIDAVNNYSPTDNVRDNGECDAALLPDGLSFLPACSLTGESTLSGFCTYQTSYCGVTIQPSLGLGVCKDLMAILVRYIDPDCTGWNYVQGVGKCHVQYLADDAACSTLHPYIDSVSLSNTTDSLDFNGDCAAADFPDPSLEFLSSCGSLASPPPAPNRSPTALTPSLPPVPSTPGPTTSTPANGDERRRISVGLVLMACLVIAYTL